MGAEAGIPFGNYTLLKRIARGGMAEVFVARQKGMDVFDRLVAIKRILPHLLDDQSFVRMFQEEARLAARLSHPNVIHIYDFGKVAEHFFIAMEYMQGVHAGDLIRLAEETKKMPVALVARIGANACAGLHYAHNRKDNQGNPLRLVHRDVSPPNLLVSYDGVVKLVDFGIAKAVNSIEQTRPGVVKGKYAFMSPEQTMGKKLDGRSDVFSLALVLWELLSGKSAVTRDDQILAMQTIRDGRVPPIQTVRKDVPTALANALGNALQKSPEKRSDARQFGKELEAFIKCSKEIATSMELGAWLSEHLTPQPFMSAFEDAPGTTPATAATSLQPLLDKLPEGIVFAHPAEPHARGSVVSKLLGEATVSDLGSMAKGELQHRSAEPAPEPKSSAEKRRGDSVVVATEFMDQETRDLRSPSPGVLAGKDLRSYLEEDSATTIVEHGFETQHGGLDEMDEPTNDLAAPTVDDPLYLPARLIEDESHTPRPKRSSGDARHDRDAGLIDSNEDVTPAGGISAAGSSSGFAQNAPWVAAALALTTLLVIATMDESAKSENPSSEDLGEQPIVFDPDEANAYRGDAGSGMPPFVVTPLPDAGEVDASLPVDPGASVTPVPHAKDGKQPRHRRPVSGKNVGRLAVTTHPMSEVYHRGSKLGSTPFTDLRLKAGRYRLTFVRKGLPSVERVALIGAGETTTLDFSFDE